ncbi:MAG: hypothetical protein V7K53_13760 [Nostoc sp.]
MVNSQASFTQTQGIWASDYELYIELSEAMIYGSLIRLMVKQMAS